MAYGYDIRPNLQGYDALTVRGIANFAALLILLFGAEFLAGRYGVGRWLHAFIQLGWVALGVIAIWSGGKSLVTDTPLPEQETTPRYAAQSIRFVSPRLYAVGTILIGALLVLLTILRIIQILSE